MNNQNKPSDYKHQIASSKEDNIKDLMYEVENIDSLPKSKFRTWLNNIQWEINWTTHRYIGAPIRSFTKGVHNLIKYRKLIWNDRWWDYSFFMEMILFKLKDTEEHWGKNTHYIGDQDDKDTLKKIVEDLEWLINADEFQEGYAEEYKKRSRSVFGRLDRNHRKFWD